MRFTLPVSILMIVALMFIGNTLYTDGDIENIYNLTENTLKWNYTYSEVAIKNVSDITSINIAQSGRLGNVINKFVDFIGYSAMEVSKYFIEYGYNHPEHNYEYGLSLMKYYLIIILVVAFIPIIIPFIALITIAVIGIRNIIYKSKRNRDKNE